MGSKGALFVVADGMGGHAAGEVASEIAVDTVSNMYYQEDSNDVAVSLLRAIRRANASIHQRAAENLLRTGMGTTCVAAVLRGNMAYIANVGDSRAYLLRGNNVKQISQDHSWVAEQVRAGLLTEEQARTHAQRNVITRCLGTQAEVDVDVFHEELHEGDLLVLCSDGLSGLVSDEELQRIVEQFVPQESVYHLVERANENGGPDNITAIVVQVQEVGEEPPGVRYPVVVGGREIGEDTVRLGMFSDSPLGAGSSNGDIGISSGPLRLSSGPLITSPDSITAPQPAIGKQRNRRPWFLYPTLAILALLIISLVGGGAFYLFRFNQSQAANQALDAVQQQITSASSESSHSAALKILATAQMNLIDVKKSYQLDYTQMQRLMKSQNDLVGYVQQAINGYNQDAKINVLPSNCTVHTINNTSTITSPESIVFANGGTNNSFLYALGLDNRLYRIDGQTGQYDMVSPLPPKNISQFSSIASNGSLLFLIKRQGNGNAQATYTLDIYQPNQQGALSAPISSTPIGSNFTSNGFMPMFITAWNNTVHVVLSSPTELGNTHILSFVLDTKNRLSAPKESQFSISAPLVSIAAFPGQLFLLLSNGDVKSLSLAPSSLPMPVLVEPQIALPLEVSAKDFNRETTVPKVTSVDSRVSTPLSIPSTTQSNPATLTTSQINGVPHLYIGDPTYSRILDLESTPTGSLTPTSAGTTGNSNSVKLQLDQQYVSYANFKQLKSISRDQRGSQLAVLTQISSSMAGLMAIQTGTQNSVPGNC